MSNVMSRVFDTRLFAAPFATSGIAKKGHELVDLRSLGMVAPVAGGARGYNASADILTQTADGRDLNDIWDEFQAAISIQNEERQRLVDLFTFPVTNTIEDVLQFGGGDFEEASEYGVPQGIRPTGSALSLGYTFKWWDLAARFTWQFLADAPAAQVEAVNQSALEADNRLVFLEVMRTLFRSDNRVATIKGQNYNVYTFWNGDGTVPPKYKNNEFDGTHTHFRVSGAAAVTSADLDEISEDFDSHGYAPENGSTKFVMVNKVEGNVIRTFRVSTGALYDFIPASGQPGLILPNESVFGAQQAAATFRGLKVIGTYGDLLIVEESYVPAGYIVGITSGGDASINNPIGFREHANGALRGLRLVKGREPDYPLIDSYYARGFGTGVRQRGAALIMQIKATGTYEAPAAYAVQV